MKDERHAQVQGWVQTRQRFSGMVWPISVWYSPSGTEFIRPESDGVDFLENVFVWPPFSMYCWPVHHKSDIFAPQPDPYRFQKYDATFTIPAYLPSV